MLKNKFFIAKILIFCAFTISILPANADNAYYGQNYNNSYGTYNNVQYGNNYNQPQVTNPYAQSYQSAPQTQYGYNGYNYNQQPANIYYQNTYPTAGNSANTYNPYYTQQYNYSRENNYTSNYPQLYNTAKDNKTGANSQTQTKSKTTYNQTAQNQYSNAQTTYYSQQNYSQNPQKNYNAAQTYSYQQPYNPQQYNTQNYPQNGVTYATSSANAYNNIQIHNTTMPPITGRIETNQKIPLYQNQSALELHDMVNKIGDRLVQKNGITTKVQFKLNSEAVQNAYTEFSGKITIYKGLIEYCEDTDELAFVIGHELGHAASKHLIKNAAVSVGVNVAAEVLKDTAISRIDSRWGRVAAGTATDFAADAITNKYGRSLEKDADLLAVDFIVAAGYNPLAGISIMNKIGDNYMDFWSDHPSTDKRIKTMYNYIKEKYPAYLDLQYDSYSYKQAVANYIK